MRPNHSPSHPPAACHTPSLPPARALAPPHPAPRRRLAAHTPARSRSRSYLDQVQLSGTSEEALPEPVRYTRKSSVFHKHSQGRECKAKPKAVSTQARGSNAQAHGIVTEVLSEYSC